MANAKQRGGGAVAGAVGLTLALSALPAAGHLDLKTPQPRLGGVEGSTELKFAPCGQSDNGRTQRVTTFEPGQTITVSWEEYVEHPGYYRIAFDREGDDDFPIRQDMDDVVPDDDDPQSVFPVGEVVLAYVFEKPDQQSYSVDVTLPDVECDGCTLQVLQFMYDKVGNGSSDEYYFQCADLTLRSAAAGGGGMAGVAGAGESPAASGGGSGGSVDGGEARATAGASSSGSNGASSGGSGSGVPEPGREAGSAGEGGGCSMARSGSATAGPQGWPLVMPLAALLRRRRRRRRHPMSVRSLISSDHHL